MLLSLNISRPEQNELSLNSQGDTIDEMVINNRMSLHIRDITGKEPKPYVINSFTADTDDDKRIILSSEMIYNNQHLSVTAQTGPDFLGELKKHDMGHLDMVLSTNGSIVKINSTMRDIFKKGDRRIHLNVAGEQLAEWQAFAGRDLPGIEDFKLESRLQLQARGDRKSVV